MTKHSKNNTARGFFTAQERAKLNYGTQRQRLGRDSLRSYDTCFLCLQSARSPMSCYQGHIYCKVWKFTDIITLI